MSEHEHEIRTRVTGIMSSPNAVDVRHAEAITKALDALLSEHRAELKALKEKHTERMRRVTKALDAAGAPTLGDSSETLDVDERIAALKEQRTSPHASAARAADGALVAYWKKKAETARSEALEEAGVTLESIGEARAAIRARSLITMPAPATIPVERVREVLVRNRNAALVAHQDLPAESIIEDMARDLGVDLDAKGEATCPGCGHPPHLRGKCHQRGEKGLCVCAVEP